MNLEFNIYKIKEDSSWYQIVKKYNGLNEFIVVGEEKDKSFKDGKKYFKMLELDENGLTVFGDLKLDEMAYLIPESEIVLAGDGVGIESTELDIPKSHLTMDLIENIQRLNEI